MCTFKTCILTMTTILKMQEKNYARTLKCSTFEKQMTSNFEKVCCWSSQKGNYDPADSTTFGNFSFNCE